jgi:hypothetical protein
LKEPESLTQIDSWLTLRFLEASNLEARATRR